MVEWIFSWRRIAALSEAGASEFHLRLTVRRKRKRKKFSYPASSQNATYKLEVYRHIQNF